MKLYWNSSLTCIYFVSRLWRLIFIIIEREKVEKYMNNAIYTCFKVLIDEKCDEVPESFKIEVGQFIKNCVMTSGE